jgi:hypothetical protein
LLGAGSLNVLLAQASVRQSHRGRIREVGESTTSRLTSSHGFVPLPLFPTADSEHVGDNPSCVLRSRTPLIHNRREAPFPGPERRSVLRGVQSVAPPKPGVTRVHRSMASLLPQHTCVQGLAADCRRILLCQGELPFLLVKRIAGFRVCRPS